ncbi:alpha/beta hydrolase [Endozoicomonas sp. SM1973]|uniref:Alpha/beta hydrolase n=1 Tax=Spartinivicinus marinus TaxID=2994442 RepID=A0A853I141_9GAMM|nr:alpha/beta hydrolase [Spartinivicinus marinus]MCX4026634.1 alpha/beta hydrolase [Spartinivicinus marinus]NYZ64468.1 alpha/beta hydrolase [Spartinivicinus marinus]
MQHPVINQQLCAQLKPLHLANPQPLTEVEQQYSAFYGIDFDTENPEINHNMGYFDSIHYRVACHYYWKDSNQGTAFVVHGYYDHVGLYGNLIKFLLDQHLNVVCFDLPGHGLSSGNRACIADFTDYVTALKQCINIATNSTPNPWFLLGQSTGGAVIADYLLTEKFTPNNCPFSKVVLFAPLIRPKNWGMIELAHRFLGSLLSNVKRSFAPNSHDEAFLHFVKHQDPLQPSHSSVKWLGALREWIKRIEHMPSSSLSPIIIQGKDDQTVDWQYNIPVLQKLFSNPTVFYLPSAKHHLVNESSSIRTEYFDYLKDILFTTSHTERFG